MITINYFSKLQQSTALEPYNVNDLGFVRWRTKVPELSAENYLAVDGRRGASEADMV